MTSRSASAAIACLTACWATQLARAEVRTLSSSPAPGPTLLIVNDPAENNCGSAVALQQVSCWPLAKGRVLTVAAAEVPSAVVSTHASAVVVMHSERSRSPSTVLAKGLDGRRLVDAMNADNDAEPPAG